MPESADDLSLTVGDRPERNIVEEPFPAPEKQSLRLPRTPSMWSRQRSAGKRGLEGQGGEEPEAGLVPAIETDVAENGIGQQATRTP